MREAHLSEVGDLRPSEVGYLRPAWGVYGKDYKGEKGDSNME
jgi:hypothetical protein